MRSVAGCLTCRRRKLKCNEERPVCGQCKKAGRICEIGELVFRHQQNASLSRDRDSLNNYFTKHRSFNSSTVWMPVPDQVTFVAEDPGVYGTERDEMQIESSPASSGALTQQLSVGAGPATDSPSNGGALTRSDVLSPMSVPSLLDKQTPPSQSQSSGGRALPSPGNFVPFEQQLRRNPGTPEFQDFRLSNHFDFLLRPAPSSLGFNGRRGSHASFVSSGTSRSVYQYAESPQSHTSQGQRSTRAVETDPEVAFLLRHFSEQPGKWLDLYFMEAYFEVKVPIKALSHPLLKYAACAYAAKHLSRTRGKTDAPRTPVRQSHVATTTSWPGSESVDWAWHGTKYYSQAIKLLRRTLERAHNLGGSSTTKAPPPPPPDDDEPGQSGDQGRTETEISDETLAAMAILCNFEFMSASDPEWTRHLSGTMLVLDLEQTGVISLMSSSPTKSRKAIFWNFFRQDVYAAFILERRTRLDMEDFSIWRVAGLEIDAQGLVLPSNGIREGAMKDDMISNALLWILAKVFNYIADTRDAKQRKQAGDSPQNTNAAAGLSPNSQASSDWAIMDRWNDISHQLDVWYDGLPDWFQPCARIERSATEPTTASSPLRPVTIPDIWFTSAMCASTIQTYHLARMLLLVHRPPQPQPVDMSLHGNAVFQFLNTNRSIESELRFRSREIFGIALSSPTMSMMLHQTQTIFIAAQCLVDNDERYMALDIMRRVNADMGWETEYRVQQLLKEWGWETSEV